MNSCGHSIDEILQIASISFDELRNLVVRAYLDEYGKQTVQQTWFDPPEYGPGLCETVLDSDFLPPQIHQNLTEKELVQLIDRHNLLENQSWFPIQEE